MATHPALVPTHEKEQSSVIGRKAKTGRKAKHEQWLTVFVLIFSDIILVLLVWQVASLLQTIWGRGPLSDITVVGIVPFTAMWIGLRALLGLYPGYGWSAVEELRRQTYAVVATLAGIAIVGIAFHVGDLISRLLLISSLLGLLVLAPLVRNFAKWQMLKIGLWGKPVVIVDSGEAGAQVVRLLENEWHLGYWPVA